MWGGGFEQFSKCTQYNYLYHCQCNIAVSLPYGPASHRTLEPEPSKGFHGPSNINPWTPQNSNTPTRHTQNITKIMLQFGQLYKSLAIL